MAAVQAKKHLGQHFLKDPNIANKIVDSLRGSSYNDVLEIGPGTGILTELLFQLPFTVHALDLDKESIAYLTSNYPDQAAHIHYGDFLKQDLQAFFSKKPFAVIGNFPYNISSQILFKVLDHVDQIPEVVGMFQKEVAERVGAASGNKTYGILSVLIQARYEVEYLFTVNENVFVPPPKVKSAVIRLTRRENSTPVYDAMLLRKIVKAAFNQRRKTMRNSLKPFFPAEQLSLPIFSKRPEQLDWETFVELTLLLQDS